MHCICVWIRFFFRDPVDSFEIHRNDVVYSYQGNRNSLIDHPEYVNLIWITIGTEQLQQQENISFYPNRAKDYIIIESSSGEKIQGEIYTLTGQKILDFKRGGQRKIKVGNLNTGSYIIRVNYNNKIFSDTLIILK